MSRYEGKHRKEDTQEIQRILGLADAPQRTMEEIAAGTEPAWASATTELPTYRRVARKTFHGPPVWRLGYWMKWIINWRIDDRLYQEPKRYGLV